MRADPDADLFARHWPRTLPQVDYQPPARESLTYLNRRLLRVIRDLDLPAFDLRQRRLLAQRCGPKLRAHLEAALARLPPRTEADLWAAAAAPVLREILERDGGMEQLRGEVQSLTQQIEDGMLLLSVEIGVLSDRVLARAGRHCRDGGGDLPPAFRRARNLQRALGLPAGVDAPLLPVPARRRSGATAWRGPLARCLGLPEALLAVASQRLRKIRRHLGGPLLHEEQREVLRRRGPHGREAVAAALMEGLTEAPALGQGCGVERAYLQTLLERHAQLRSLRSNAVALSEQVEGAQLLLGAYGRSLYELLMELFQEWRHNPQLPETERQRLAPLLHLARTRDELVQGSDCPFFPSA
ncbi:MAG: hypothetical protein RMK29_02195 [Myxococcales bacterium]|nr:hypothetical protein [Myxococcota bacterium]MDW8280491.1 hypothetical protein [Myxococcales bacterium]